MTVNIEKSLISEAVSGDQQAMSSLVEIHSPKIYNVALRIMNNQEDAEDVLQETFITMMNKLHTFSGNSSIYTWLYRIATNIALGKLRQKKHIDNYISIEELSYEPLHGYSVSHWPDHLEDHINEEEFQECLTKAMGYMPENYREVFVLRDLENMSTRETAELLKISEANVKVRLMRARMFLRDILANHLKCIEIAPKD